MDWNGLFHPGVSIAEKILRPLVAYLFLLIAFRIAGKRELGQITPFDLVVLLTISNVLQNAMIGNDNSLLGGLIGAVTLFTANGVLSRLAFKFPAVARLVEEKPTVLIENGQVLKNNLRREVMTEAELERSLRKHGLDLATDLPTIKQALLEGDGSVTICSTEAGHSGAA